MTYSHILWDFNGTVLDDVGVGIDCINALLSRRGLPTLRSRAEYRAKFCFPIIEYYRRVGFDFEKEPYVILADEWVQEYRRREAEAPLCPYVIEALDYAASLNVPQILFSATERNMLLSQVRRLGIDTYFSCLLGTDDVYAYGKTEVGKMWAAAERPRRALLIGDTVHDAQSAAEMGAECVLVAAGHQSAETLRSVGVPVIDDLSQLPAFLRNTIDKPGAFCYNKTNEGKEGFK